MLELEGVHGTTVSRSLLIKKGGFRLPKSGRFLTGAYFWRKSRHSDALAEGWWRFQLSRKRYHSDQDSRCAILYVLLSVPEERYFDMERFEVKEELDLLAEETGLKGVNETAKLYDLFIGKLEQKLGTKFYVIELRVTAPPRDFCDAYPIHRLGPPFCYVARNVGCIKVLEVER